MEAFNDAIAEHSIFSRQVVPHAPEDNHYGLRAAFQADKAAEKIDLVIGAYRNDEGQPWILPVVKKAERLYFEDSKRNHEYLPITGLMNFTSAAQNVILGTKSDTAKTARVCSIQTISGTGAVHLGGLFLSKFLGNPSLFIYLSSPTWDNHERIFRNVGLLVKRYPYYSKASNSIDFDGMLSTLKIAPRGSIVLLQACAHNPTGLDLSQSQWQDIAHIVRSGGLIPFFDCAYQGFSSGSLSQDSWAVRYFVDQGIELVIAQSFSKNLGLYGQRVGCFHYVAPPCADVQDIVTRVGSQLSLLQRCEISTAPIYGAKLASIVLNDQQLFQEWEKDLQTMSGRIQNMRKVLRQSLESLETPGHWSHITDQIGMFCYTGLSTPQVIELRTRWHVYMLEDGRLSMSGLNRCNIQRFATALDDVVRRVQ